jgi:AraC family transcriptional regulator of adaptative response/methylated-DNA-[protein]-cysteine methyltransferase
MPTDGRRPRSHASFRNADPHAEGLRFCAEATPIGVVAGAGTPDGLRALALLGTDAEAVSWGEAQEALPALAGHPLIGWVGSVAWAVSAPPELGDLSDEKLRAVPIDLSGTPFQLALWEHLRALRWGETTTYGALAAALGQPQGAQAAAQACAANPVAVVVPCHRVVGADGSLTGYRWGLGRKRALLAREAPQADLFG